MVGDIVSAYGTGQHVVSNQISSVFLVGCSRIREQLLLTGGPIRGWPTPCGYLSCVYPAL